MKLLIGLALILAACVPVEYAEVDAGPPQQWYYECSWESPCVYPNDVVFVYGYGMLPRQQYVYYYQYPTYRVKLVARPGWHPRDYPKGHEHGHGEGKGHKEHGKGHGKGHHHGHDDDR